MDIGQDLELDPANIVSNGCVICSSLMKYFSFVMHGSHASVFKNVGLYSWFFMERAFCIIN